MNIEDAIEILKDNIKSLEGNTPFKHTNYKKVQAIETLLTAYEKEKEKNKRFEKFIENGEYTWKQKYNETFEYFKEELEKEKRKK